MQICIYPHLGAELEVAQQDGGLGDAHEVTIKTRKRKPNMKKSW